MHSDPSFNTYLSSADSFIRTKIYETKYLPKTENSISDICQTPAVAYDKYRYSLNSYTRFSSWLCICITEPGSSVSIVSGYGLDNRAINVRSPAEAKGFFL
jgi:hypothetical protein